MDFRKKNDGNSQIFMEHTTRVFCEARGVEQLLLPAATLLHGRRQGLLAHEDFGIQKNLVGFEWFMG